MAELVHILYLALIRINVQRSGCDWTNRCPSSGGRRSHAPIETITYPAKEFLQNLQGHKIQHRQNAQICFSALYDVTNKAVKIGLLWDQRYSKLAQTIFIPQLLAGLATVSLSQYCGM